MLQELITSPWFQLISIAWIVLLAWLGFRPLEKWKYRHLPGPFALPFLGSLPQVLMQDIPVFLRRCGDKYGRVFQVWLGGVPWVVVNDPDVAHRLGMTLQSRPDNLNNARLWPKDLAESTRQGIVMLSGAPWRLARRAFEVSVMHPKSLAGHSEAMQRCANQLSEVLAGYAASGVPIDIWRELGNMTMAVVGSTAFGVDFHTLDTTSGKTSPNEQGNGSHDMLTQERWDNQRGRRLVTACMDFFKQASLARGSKWPVVAMMLPTLRPLLHVLANTMPDKGHTAIIQARRDIGKVSEELVEAWKVHTKEAVEAVEANGHATSKSPASRLDHVQPISKSSFLRQLLEGRARDSGQQLSESEVLAQPVTFLVAGYETTANTLGFTIYLLSQHPEAERQLLEEVDLAMKNARERAAAAAAAAGGGVAACVDGSEKAAKGTDSGLLIPSAEDLPFAEACFKEAMRMYPPGTAIVRKAPPQGLDIQGIRIPGDSTVMIPVYSFHHDARYFPEPDVFRPERFLKRQSVDGMDGGPEAVTGITNPHAYMPFGVGARMCVGYKFALMEGVLALATLYSRFTFKLEPGQVPMQTRTGIVLAPVNGVWVTVHKRGSSV